MSSEEVRSQRFISLYKDSEIKRRKLAKEKKAMDLTRQISELKECTFTPNLSRQSPGFNKENV
jgi:hypothetical protein